MGDGLLGAGLGATQLVEANVSCFTFDKAFLQETMIKVKSLENLKLNFMALSDRNDQHLPMRNAS